METTEREAARAEAETDRLREAVASADAEITALRSALDSAETRIASLESEISAARASASMPAEQRHQLESELEALRDAVARHASTERELRHRLEAAERRPPTEADEDDGPALAAARRRIAELEAGIAAPAPDESVPLRQKVTDLTARLESMADELTRVRADRDSLRSEVAHARAAVTSARDDADRRIAAAAAEVARQSAKAAEMERAAEESDDGAARLIVRDAEIRDLEARLAALSAARESELRRLNDKISSMEHLYVEVEARDRRIEQLEDEVKSLAEARDEAVAELERAERELVAIQGSHAEATASLERLSRLQRELVEARTRITELEQLDQAGSLREEVDRLQRTLAGERDRNARLQRRLSLEAETPAGAPSYAEWDRRTREQIDAAVARAVGPLEARIEQLRIVVDEKERRLASLVQPVAADGPADLTRISGIGPKIQAILHDLGITTFREIAAFTDEDVERVGAALPVYGRRILDDDWIGQARELAGGGPA
ncbi:MAG: hypothetical protein R3190_11140 [Thermoanaerobaculia bacterium]|nr:hypothetical protein [Thermoanaerobaculia bacterium]